MIEDALYHLVHDYPGGAVALAPRLGLAPSTLQSMANPNQPAHNWSLKHLRAVLTLTGDLRPLHALCAENGGVFVPVGSFGAVSDTALLETLTKLCKEFGDVSAALNDTLADGRVTHSEVDRLKQQVYEMNQAAAELLNRVAQLEEVPSLRVVARGHEAAR